jgi:hypothetical protein
MGALGTPLHLLPLGKKALGDDVVHRRFDKACADSVSLAIALAVVGDEGLIVGNNLGRLQVELEELLGVQVDLLTPGDLPLKFRDQVFMKARLI